MLSEKRLLISFSGGETSGLMTQYILEKMNTEYDKIEIVFANTGQENEETLVFVDKCDRFIFSQYGKRVVWVEAVQNHGMRKSAGHRIVSYSTANRDGAVFEDMIKKYGIPNQAFPHCTRDLKLAPINSYMRSIGWKRGSYDTAIGIRADEIDRISEKAEENRIIYPLIKRRPTGKPGVNTYWRAQPFRLGISGYRGNCKWCWKKSDRKHYTLMAETPEVFDFPLRMELLYARVGL